MKKVFAILCILSLLLCGCVVEDEGLSRPPRLDAFYGEQSLQLSSGDYSWDYHNESVIADGVHPLDLHQEWDTLEISAEGTIRLCFFAAPEGVTVQCWSAEEVGNYQAEPEIIETDEADPSDPCEAIYEFIPSKGEYIYRVSASWKNGGASYTFATK